VGGFRFQEEVTVSEDTYVLLHGFPRRVNWLRAGAWLAASAVFLWFHTTRWLGAVLLAMWVLGQALNWWTPRAARREYRHDRPYLHGPVICGASDEAVWLHGGDFEVHFPWTQEAGWRRGSGWLWIAGKGGGIAYFKEDSLREAGLYDALVSTAGAHGREGDKIVHASSGGSAS
jgi:hypothetical protein